jgi:dienelactone hydrolase
MDVQEFNVDASGRSVPGVVWRPGTEAPGAPLVLVGHGGTGHKLDAHMLGTVDLLVGTGWPVAAIDGPAHGRRRPNGGDADDEGGTWQDFIELRERVGLDALALSMTEDWIAALDFLLRQPDLAARPVAYWGLSMGGRYGVPFVAHEPRIAAAVLGLVGTNAQPSIVADAARITCPVLFVLDTDDELFPLDHGVELFRALGSEDRRLHVFPGPHGTMPPDEPSTMRDFLASRLA